MCSPKASMWVDCPTCLKRWLYYYDDLDDVKGSGQHECSGCSADREKLRETAKLLNPCDVCGFFMTRPGVLDFGVMDGIIHTVIGLTVNIDPKLQSFVSRHTARQYNICYSCCLEAAGIKPNLLLVEDRGSIGTTKVDPISSVEGDKTSGSTPV
mgnify:CR=1 FL=1